MDLDSFKGLHSGMVLGCANLDARHVAFRSAVLVLDEAMDGAFYDPDCVGVTLGRLDASNN